MSMEEAIRRIVREENEKHLEDIKCLLESHGYKEVPKFLSVREAAKIMRMGRTSTYELVKQKEHNGFPAFRESEGAPIKIPYTALMNWIDQQVKQVI